ncbi:glycosyl hydrolase [Salinimicrobium marinum]|uniref:Glycosyl hydrolase n=1 Tax=Salinimicrobium marinum TaxID=680283 RepID=A0A918SEY5_9FLAO|nr:DUF1080 domain-containing protein [Salinimicrobium marinum]GHA38566.1 glycosyl hydrolase [Salinimicrobium marinum]
MKKILFSLFIATAFVGCKNSEAEKSEVQEKESENVTATSESENEEWQSLFDGNGTEGWRMYNGEELSDTWIVEDGTLKSLGTGGDIGGDIVYGDEEFGEFELQLEWKIAEGGNSGIFYHVVEDEQYDAPYYTAPEYQIIDQEGFPQKLEPWQSIGADYGMYDPDYDGALKDVGEWNTSRIVFTNDKVTYWLNGKKTVEFDPWSEDWKKRKNEGKWSEFEDYGEAREGLIGLQDHGSYTWFRNIKIRRL